MALPARRERLLARASELRGRAAAHAAGRSRRPSRGELCAAADLLAAADRRSGSLGPGARHRGPGREGRDHRLRHRPRTSVLRPGRLRHARRLPERAAALHYGEGHRRARVRAEGLNRGKRACRVLRRRLESRHARRRHRRRQRRHERGRPARLGRGSACIPRQLQGLRRDEHGAEPERQLTRDRRRDRGGGGRRHERDQLLRWRAGDRAEPRHRRDRARRGGSRRRRTGRRGRERLQRSRRRVRVLARQLGTGDRGRCRRDRRQPDDSDAR